MKKLNFKKLRQEMDAVSNELRFIRSNGFSPANHSREYLRQKMTILCSIRAHHHGRLHRIRVRNPYANLPGQPKTHEMTVEDQVKLIREFIEDYEQEVAPAN